jgi:hypothetical protein
MHDICMLCSVLGIVAGITPDEGRAAAGEGQLGAAVCLMLV